MSKKQLLRDNLIMFVGGNIANALNYLLNIVLSRKDDTLFNLYTAYTSLSLILLIPSQVSLRVFTVFGNPIIENLRRFYIKNKNKVLVGFIVLALSLIPFNIILTKYSQQGTAVTSILLVILGLIGCVSYVFRGIRQNEEDYKIAALSLNLEAVSRFILGLVFAVYLNMGVSGILIAHIIGLVASLILCFDFRHIKKALTHNDEVRLQNLFVNTFWLTAGLEFFSNFDTAYANHVLNPNDVKPSPIEQTQYNTVQFFRKIIFFGTYTVSSIVLSMGGKSQHSKKFMFFYTLAVGLTIGLGSSLGFLLFKDILLGFLKKDISLIDDFGLVKFLTATTLMSVSYLLSNWLYTLKQKLFIYLPVVASVVQFLLYIGFAVNLSSILSIFFISSLIFFVLIFTAGLREVYKPISQDFEEANING